MRNVAQAFILPPPHPHPARHSGEETGGTEIVVSGLTHKNFNGFLDFRRRRGKLNSPLREIQKSWKYIASRN